MPSAAEYMDMLHKEICKMCPGNCKGENPACLYHIECLGSIFAQEYREMRDGKDNN